MEEKYFTVQDLIDLLSQVEDKQKYIIIEYHDDIMYRWEHVDSWYEDKDIPTVVLQTAGMYKGPYSD